MKQLVTVTTIIALTLTGCNAVKQIKEGIVGRKPSVVASPDIKGMEITRVAIYVPHDGFIEDGIEQSLAAVHTGLQEGLFEAGIGVVNRLDLEALDRELEQQEVLSSLPEGARRVLEDVGAQALLIANVTTLREQTDRRTGFATIACEVEYRLLSAAAPVELVSGSHGYGSSSMRLGGGDQALTGVCRQLAQEVGTAVRSSAGRRRKK